MASNSELSYEELCKHILITDVVWKNPYLGMTFSVACNASTFVGFEAYLDFYTDTATLAHVPCGILRLSNQTLWYAAVNLDTVISRFTETVQTDICMKLTLRNGMQVFQSACANQTTQINNCFKSFVSGFYLFHNILAIPDINENKDFTLRIIGLLADVSQEPFAAEKPNRPYVNCILLKALSQGKGVAHVIATDILRNELSATVHVDNEGTAFATCCIESVPEQIQQKLRQNTWLSILSRHPKLPASLQQGACFDVDISASNDLEEITLLDNGKPLDNVTYDVWLREEKRLLLQPLFYFDTICRKNRIKYTLAWGSLIGAVRHKGIIPWDHDVDLFMDLSNYNKLRALMDSPQAPVECQLDDWSNCPGYPGIMGRFVFTNTTKLNYKNTYGHCGIGGFGVAFDIYILLPLSGPFEKAQDQAYTYLVFDELSNKLKRKRLCRPQAFLEKYSSYLERCETEGEEAVLAELSREVLVSTREDAEYYIATASDAPSGYIYKKEWFDTIIEMPFEDRTLPCPADYLEILLASYGPGFRKYPPDHKPHHYHHFRSESIPYSIPLATYKSQIDFAQEFEDRAAFKAIQMEEVYKKSYINRAIYTIKAMAAAQKLELNYQKLLAASSGQPSAQSLDTLFNTYYAEQTSRVNLDWKTIIPISPRLLLLALYNLLCYRGESGDAYLIIRAYKEANQELGASCDTLVNAVEKTVAMRNSYDYHNKQRARALAREVLEMYPDAVEAQSMLYLLDLEESTGNQLTAKTEENIKTLALHTSSRLPAFLMAMLHGYSHDPAHYIPLAHYYAEQGFDGMFISRLFEADVSEGIYE
ncbi:MAG: LicD family protein [Coriobacteriales bacterium]|nr:LicD family protein [Coriobacteriales bacterium]